MGKMRRKLTHAKSLIQPISGVYQALSSNSFEVGARTLLFFLILPSSKSSYLFPSQRTSVLNRVLAQYICEEVKNGISTVWF